MPDPTETERLEQRALTISMWGSLLAALLAIIAAWLSQAQVILLDGLFSLVDFVAALIGARISIDVHRGPDRRRPFGYAAQESAFTTFRSLSLLAIVVFGLITAVRDIFDYVANGTTATLDFRVILVYVLLLLALCGWLFQVSRSAWIRTGRQSEILKLETDVALLAGVTTAAYGAALLLLPFLDGTPLAFLVPIGDPLIVILVSLFMLWKYGRDFRAGLAQLLGATANPQEIRAATRAVRGIFEDSPGEVIDVALVRMGRRFDAVVFFDPEAPITAREVDSLTLSLEEALNDVLGPVEVYLVLSEYGRAWGQPDVP
ncbi:cation transporter [Pseudooceanicola sp. LIPI14-2-Ac024]|uniref:cation transporter n=1 Tax=Pseudooceanicola sp. LIPI14-2-Ac024 TaxID=3344875 RepID=UPI0035CED2C6